MLKKIGIGLVVVVGLFVVVVATRPATYHVERSRTIPAPIESVYPIVSDMTKFPSWSPWQKLDPNVKSDFSGEPGAVGQRYHWTGNDDVGEGSMVNTAVTAPTSVSQDLEFIRPFASKARINLALAADGGSATKVTWSMDGDNNFMGKMMSLFMSMDSMIGKDFEDGLANLEVQAKLAAQRDEEAAAAKKAAEDAAAAAAAAAAADAAALAAGTPPAVDAPK